MLAMHCGCSQSQRLNQDPTCLFPQVTAWLDAGDRRDVVMASVKTMVRRETYHSDADWLLAAAHQGLAIEIRDYYWDKTAPLRDTVTPFQIKLLSVAMLDALTAIYERAVESRPGRLGCEDVA